VNALKYDIVDPSGFVRINTSGGCTYIQSGLTNTLNSAAPCIFSTIQGGTEWMRISAAGNVGIGKSIPSCALDVSGSVNVSGTITSGNNTSLRYWTILGTTGGSAGAQVGPVSVPSGCTWTNIVALYGTINTGVRIWPLNCTYNGNYYTVSCWCDNGNLYALNSTSSLSEVWSKSFTMIIVTTS